MASFNNELLDFKRKKFYSTIYRVCKNKGISPMPEISFASCPQETPDELAHYHPDKNRICISTMELNRLDLDSIEHVAIHELSHVFELGHGGRFQTVQSNLQTSKWFDQPKSKKKGSKKALKKQEKKLNECSYHLCDQKKDLQKCNYCKEYYCQEHLTPTRPAAFWFEEGKQKGQEPLRHQKLGHPCIQYAHNMLNEDFENEEPQYQQSVNQQPTIREFNCPNCGKSFERSKYCCAVCAKDFCSKECALPATHGCFNYKIRINQRENKAEKISTSCPHCGKPNKDSGYFCSMCARDFCSKECALPTTHGCLIHKPKTNESRLGLIQKIKNLFRK